MANSSEWNDLRQALAKATESEARTMLQIEQAGARRLSFLLRIYGRYNLIRSRRERTELFGKSVPKL